MPFRDAITRILLAVVRSWFAKNRLTATNTKGPCSTERRMGEKTQVAMPSSQILLCL